MEGRERAYKNRLESFDASCLKRQKHRCRKCGAFLPYKPVRLTSEREEHRIYDIFEFSCTSDRCKHGGKEVWKSASLRSRW